MRPAPFLCLLLGGCASSPSIGVLGAFFPDWMFCILGALVLTAVVHALFRAAGRLPLLGERTSPLIHASLTSVLALGAWLIFFKN